MQSEYRIKDFKVLSRKDETESLKLLKELAAEIQPIMMKYKWTVGLLSEFMPSNSNLLGLNIGAGVEIRIRLRNIGDSSSFMPRDDLIGTLLHELCHIVHGGHGPNFQSLLDKLYTEHENGLTATPYFEGKSRRLGGTFVGCGLDAQDRIAALTRQSIERRCFATLPTRQTGNGCKLGSKSETSTIPTVSPSMAAAYAAMTRAAARTCN